MCRLLLLGLALCGTAQATPPPRVEMTVTPAWKGWARPGRATEVDVRLTSGAATRATLDVVADRHAVGAEVDLEPGRAVRLQVPVASAKRIVVSAAAPGAPPQRRDIELAQSESPLLGVALATDERVDLEGFHTVALAADDLPRNASAFLTIDALVVDAPTLSALDPRQLGALLAHAAACGRVVMLNTDPRVRRLLDGAGGCGGRALMSAASLADAKAMLASSLAVSMPAAISPGVLADLSRPDQVVWNRVAVALAVYFAAAALALLFVSSLPVLVLTPALAGVAVLALLHAKQPQSQLVVWSEGESGSQVARYQAWQRFPGLVRERMRVPIPPQLASSAHSCESTQALRLDFDASRGSFAFAEFETRLFRQVSLCYAGSFPMARAIEIAARADGMREVRNVGTMAWPRGALLDRGLVHDLPALGAAAHTTLGEQTGKLLRDAVVRTALTRIRPDGFAALWELELGGVADVGVESKGWLLVSMASP
ncbi:MAG: hypothetical protein Q7U73_14120 [Rubrivivax sp.]|nr:hypothetical protein [Rubrivivax sp.]